MRAILAAWLLALACGAARAQVNGAITKVRCPNGDWVACPGGDCPNACGATAPAAAPGGWTPGQQATLNAAQTGINAASNALANGITNFLRGPRPDPAAQRRRQLELERQRQAADAQKAVDAARFHQGRSDLVNEFKEACFCPIGTPVASPGGGCSCVPNAPTESLDVVFARNEKLFSDRAAWDHYRARTLAIQREHMRRNPRNRELEQWCRTHAPLAVEKNEKKRAWMKRCGAEDEPAAPAAQAGAAPDKAAEKAPELGAQMKAETTLFRTRKKWDDYRDRSLALQKEATERDPANAKHEDWCRKHAPLFAVDVEDKAAWKSQCGAPEPRAAAPAPAAAPAGKASDEAPVRLPGEDLPMH